MAELRSYQHDIIDFMLSLKRGNVWAKMGMGKTVSVETALVSMSLMTDVFPVLVIAPKRVAQSVWPQEIAKWPQLRGLRVVQILGSERERKAALTRKADVYTINYDNLVWLSEQLQGKWPFRVVIADEATRLKGFRLRHGGKRASALARFARVTPRWFNLTGTPAAKGYKDLWGQQFFIDQGRRLGLTHEAFMERFFIRDPYTREVTPFAWSQGQINELLADCTIALDPADYFDLPPLVVNNVYVDLPQSVRRIYRDMEVEFFAELEQGAQVEAAMAATKSQKLLQIASGNVILTDEDGRPTKNTKVIHDEKLDALIEIMENNDGEPLLVAYHFIHDRDRILRTIPGSRYLDDDPKTIEDWNAGRIPMLVTHPKSAGHGLNLQDGGRAVVLYNHWWSTEEYLQLIERVGPTRQVQAGHPRPVFVHNIVARDTVDEAVLLSRDVDCSASDALMNYMRNKR